MRCSTAVSWWLRGLSIVLLLLGPLVVGAVEPTIELSPEERRWLDQHQTIRLAVDVAWRPFEFIDKQGQYRGLAADTMGLVEQRLGIRFEVEKGMSWREVVDAMQERRLDLYSSVVKTSAREQYVSFTRPYLSFPMVIVTRENIKFIDGLAGLVGKSIGVVDGYASEDLLREHHPELQLVTATTLSAGLEQVATGELFAFVDNLAAISDVMRHQGLTNLKISGQTPYRFELGMAARNDWPQLLPILQKALDSITETERDAIYNRWISIRHEYSLDGQGQLILSAIVIITILLLFVWFWNRSLKREINSRQQVEQSLRASEFRLERAQEIAHLGHWDLNIRTGNMVWSDEIYRIYGLDIDTFQPDLEGAISLMHPDDRRKVRQAVQNAVLSLESHYRIEHRVLPIGGGERKVLATANILRDEHGTAIQMVGTLQDITELSGAYERLELAHYVIENVSEAIVITDPAGVITDINPAFEQITGYGRGDALGAHSNLTKSGRHDAAFYQQMWEALAQHGCWEGEIWDRHKGGAVFPTWLTITAIRDEQQIITHYVGLFRDISAQKQAEADLERLAFYDPLTGLPNRALFQDRLAHELQISEREGQELGLMFIDLDRFKYVNDTLGHHMGDLLLQQVALRLESALRKSDTVARMGGDEFTVIVPTFDQMESLGQLADKLLQQLQSPFTLGGEEVFIGASIGIAIYPQDGLELALLGMNADTAMYQAKEHGRNTYRFFNPEMNRSNETRLSLERELRYALERNELSLVYQPKVDLSSGVMMGVEALVRWNHSERGMIPPLEFIPLAEETGLIVPIGDWILQEACRQAAHWERTLPQPLRMAVNLSARQFKHSQVLVDSVQEALDRSGLNPLLLELELTESMVMGGVDAAIWTMHALRGMGVELAIDDFGTGYSSLAYLKQFPINTLKIDQGFVRDLSVDSDDAAIVQAIIALARSMGLDVVAEGIETPAQQLFLQQNLCTIGQGYLFSRPLPPQALEESALFAHIR